MGAVILELEGFMYRTWTTSAGDAETVARDLEAHLNEFAAEVISVTYAVGAEHTVLAVYRAIDVAGSVSEEAVVTAAEHIIDEMRT